VDLNSALFVVPQTQGAQAWITQFYLQLHQLHQMAPPQTEVVDI